MKTVLISQRRRVRRDVWVKTLQALEVLGGLCAFAREKTNKLSPGRKARKGVWGKNKIINIEILCGLCASARK